MGYEIDEIKQDVLYYVENVKLADQYSSGNMVYDDAANLLSLAYLFDIVLTAVAKALRLDKSVLCDSKYIASDLL